MSWAASLRLIIWVRGLGFSKVNSVFNYGFYGASALAGSISSFFLTSAMIWAFIRTGFRHFPLRTDFRLRVVALLFALYPASEIISVLANGRSINGLIECGGSLLALAILPVASRLLLSSPQDISNSAGRGAAIGGIVTLIYCVIQFVFLDYQRPEGGSGNASVLAYYALVLWCLCYCLLPVVDNEFRNLLKIGALCCLGAIILSSTRAVWIATLCAGAVMAWQMRSALLRSLINIALFWKLLFAATILPAAAYLVFQRVKMTVDSFNTAGIASTDISISSRLIMWRGGWAQFEMSPFFGYGPDSTREMIAALGGDAPLSYSHYHNIFLTAAIRGGRVEVTAIVFIFCALGWFALKKSNDQFETAGRTLILAVGIASFVSGMANVIFTHDITNAMFIYTIIVGLCLGISKTPPAKKP